MVSVLGALGTDSYACVVTNIAPPEWPPVPTYLLHGEGGRQVTVLGREVTSGAHSSWSVGDKDLSSKCLGRFQVDVWSRDLVETT